MITKEYIFLILVIVFMLIMVLVKMYRKKSEEYVEENKIRGICAFDIDGTITCGVKRASEAIAKCRELGYKISINTARPTKWYDDLNLVKLGISEDEIMNDFYHGEPYTCSFTDVKCFEDRVSETKVKHLYSMSEKWGVDPKRVILFDDQWSNITKAKNAGFSVIHANHSVCGLPDNVVELIDKINKIDKIDGYL